jgi:hypothetical protein
MEWYVGDGHYYIELRIYKEKGNELNMKTGVSSNF